MEIKYSCDYCDAVFCTETPCRDHEAGCSLNPSNKTCDTCRFYSITYYEDTEQIITRCMIREFDPFMRNCDTWELLTRDGGRKKAKAKEVKS
jgi:hypothetical protein